MSAETCGTALEAVEVVNAELVETAPGAGGNVTVYAPAAAAVLAALEQGAEEHLEKARPRKNQVSYARDWALWTEFHAGSPNAPAPRCR
ncbi:hypothetical protein ACIO3O_37690 [Streptomyces sp. NPDC087440]|uniref:hypothetical protein n=1 Tax=Streptomyces sp. NPDC087440 TaxID=3365790 RepID=UPI0037F113F4